MAHPYRLTPRMVQNLASFLKKYHELFSGGRCAGWELEELVVKAIKSDTQANHHVKWREGGHDFEEDINVRTNGQSYSLQIKSGQIKNDCLVLSGNRLGRFDGDFSKITGFLNNKKDNVISLPYNVVDDEKGRTHKYKLVYIDIILLKGLSEDQWQEKGKQYIQKTSQGVECSLRPKMSWQIWWQIPLDLLELKDLAV